MIESPLLFAANISTLIVILFSANLLVFRSHERQVYLPLAICLLAVGIIISQPTLAVFAGQLQPLFLIFSLPAILLISPCLWLYVEGLTSEKLWRMERKYIPHFIPFGLGAIIALMSVFLPLDIKNALLVEGNDQILQSIPVALRYFIYGLLITTFVLVLGWVIQSGVYFYKIIITLSRYRARLKDIFASTETKEIRWLTWLLCVVGIVWLSATINIVLDNLFITVQWNTTATNIFMLVMIWSVATWGLRQKPGFEELYHDNEPLPESLTINDLSQSKYQRSALSKEQSAVIAEKIERAMHEDKLYLDPAISLQKLAKHIFTSPNYISQTLNETLNMSFFDYINKYRIADALLMLEKTNDTVLDVAMAVGFNAKSSFYTAFKKETQQTPSQFRKQYPKVKSS